MNTKMTRKGWILLTCALFMTGVLDTAVAQQGQSVSLGELARRLRDEKKAAAKPARVWDNDNIPKRPSAVSVVGQAAEEAPEGTAENAAAPTGTPANASAIPAGPAVGAAASEADGKAQDASQVEAALADAKAQLASLQSDLDLLRRQLVLDQQQFYSKPDFASDKDGKAKLQAESEQVDAKQQEVAAAQQKVSELEAKLDSPKQEGNSP